MHQRGQQVCWLPVPLGTRGLGRAQHAHPPSMPRNSERLDQGQRRQPGSPPPTSTTTADTARSAREAEPSVSQATLPDGGPSGIVWGHLWTSDGEGGYGTLGSVQSTSQRMTAEGSQTLPARRAHRSGCAALTAGIRQQPASLVPALGAPRAAVWLTSLRRRTLALNPSASPSRTAARQWYAIWY